MIKCNPFELDMMLYSSQWCSILSYSNSSLNINQFLFVSQMWRLNSIMHTAPKSRFFFLNSVGGWMNVVAMELIGVQPASMHLSFRELQRKRLHEILLLFNVQSLFVKSFSRFKWARLIREQNFSLSHIFFSCLRWSPTLWQLHQILLDSDFRWKTVGCCWLHRVL